MNEYLSLLMMSEVLGERVSEEGEMIKDIIDQHPEYAGFLLEGEIEMADGTTVNPRLHIAIEAIVQRQMAMNEPPEVRGTYLTLLNEGVDPHEARHAIGHILIETIWLMQKSELSTDPNIHYRNHLRDLKRKKLKHRVFTAWSKTGSSGSWAR